MTVMMIRGDLYHTACLTEVLLDEAVPATAFEDDDVCVACEELLVNTNTGDTTEVDPEDEN